MQLGCGARNISVGWLDALKTEHIPGAASESIMAAVVVAIRVVVAVSIDEEERQRVRFVVVSSGREWCKQELKREGRP